MEEKKAIKIGFWILTIVVIGLVLFSAYQRKELRKLRKDIGGLNKELEWYKGWAKQENRLHDKCEERIDSLVDWFNKSCETNKTNMMCELP